MPKLKFAFFGTPEVASETLEILKSAGILPTLIITAPDRPKGRGMRLQQSPVAQFAEQNNIACLKPEKLDSEFINKLSTISYKLFIVVAYGQIIPEKILNLPQLGSINIHYSLLPKHRGASPVETAILNGETKTGVTIQKMVQKMDAGPILAQRDTDILPDETAPELRARLIKLGGELLVQSLPKLVSGKLEAREQNESEVSFCHKIEKEDGLINLEDDPQKNYNKFRAYAAWPRIFFFKDNKRVIITDASLENGKFVIKKIIPEGKKEISYANSIYVIYNYKG